MSKSSQQLRARVLAALQAADTPLKTSEVALIVGKSNMAVAHALKDVGAHKIVDTYPTEWTIDEGMAANVVVHSLGKEKYTVTSPKIENIVTAWNESHESLGRTIMELSIEPDSNPKDLAKRFSNAAGRFAAIAHELERHAAKPDWYLILTESE